VRETVPTYAKREASFVFLLQVTTTTTTTKTTYQNSNMYVFWHLQYQFTEDLVVDDLSSTLEIYGNQGFVISIGLVGVMQIKG